MKDNDFKKEFFSYTIPIFFPIIINLFFIGINFKYWFPVTIREGILVETIIVYSFTLLIFGITGKWKTAITIDGIVAIVLGLVNQLKYSFMSEPVVLSDLLFLKNTGEIYNFVEGEVWNNVKKFLIPVIIEIAVIVGLIIIGRKISKEIQVEKKARLVFAIISIFTLNFLLLPIQSTNKFIKKTIFTTDDRVDYDGFVTLGYYYLTYGIIGGIYGQYLEGRQIEPDGYDEAEVDKALAEADSKKDHEADTKEQKLFGKPNIIVVFSEAFWDIDQLDEIEFNVPVTSNLNELKKKGLFFNMISPSYGGVSANVEYEFMTGSNTMYFNHGYIPYMQLYRDDKCYEKPSIIHELNNNGYRTKMATYTTKELFSCDRVYKYFQVDDVEYNIDIEEKNKKGRNVSDEYVTDRIINEFNNKDKDEKLFYMALTLQAHLPYPKDVYDKYDVWVTKSNLSEDMNETVKTYAQGVYDADKQLGRLYEYIQTLDEPTIIVFFGDHLPYLLPAETNVIDVLDYFNTPDETLNTFRRYNTQSLIVSNFDINKEAVDTKYIGPDLLSSFVLNNMDIEISNYYKWLYQNRSLIGSSNYLVTVDNDGNLYKTSELKGARKDIYNLRKNIEYKLFVK